MVAVRLLTATSHTRTHTRIWATQSPSTAAQPPRIHNYNTTNPYAAVRSHRKHTHIFSHCCILLIPSFSRAPFAMYEAFSSGEWKHVLSVHHLPGPHIKLPLLLVSMNGSKGILICIKITVLSVHHVLNPGLRKYLGFQYSPTMLYPVDTLLLTSSFCHV